MARCGAPLPDLPCFRGRKMHAWGRFWRMKRARWVPGVEWCGLWGLSRKLRHAIGVPRSVLAGTPVPQLGAPVTQLDALITQVDPPVTQPGPTAGRGGGRSASENPGLRHVCSL